MNIIFGLMAVRFKRFIHKYINISIRVSAFFIVSCSVPEPVIVSNIINNCQNPGTIEYYEYNDLEYNKEIEKLVQKWPVHLQEYLHLKMNNRIIQHERCISYSEEYEIYSRCLIQLIKMETNDPNNE